MRYRALTSTGDYRLGRGSQEFLVNTPACVGQAVLTALLLHQGEWFLDLTVGMPWETQVLGKGTLSLYDAAIKAAILNVQGVKSILSYESILGAPLANPPSNPSSPITIVNDNFLRANQSPIGFPWTVVGAGALPGSIQLLNGAVSPFSLAQVGGAILYNARVWTPNQSSSFQIVNLMQGAGYIGAILRADLLGENFYYMNLDASAGFGGLGLLTPLNLQKVVGGVLQGPPFFSFGYFTPRVGDQFAVQINGGTIAAFQNGKLLGSFTDPSPIATGVPGLFAEPVAGIAAVTDLAMTNWLGGSPIDTSGVNVASVSAQPRNLQVNVTIDTIFGPTAIATTLPTLRGYGVGPFAQIPYGGGG